MGLVKANLIVTLHSWRVEEKLSIFHQGAVYHVLITTKSLQKIVSTLHHFLHLKHKIMFEKGKIGVSCQVGKYLHNH